MEKYIKRVQLTMHTDHSAESFKITGSQSAAAALRKIFPEGTIGAYESVVAIFFNQRNESVGWFQVSQGGINQSVVDVRMIFSAALGCLAVSMVLCHNHPSGNLAPSKEDRKITDQLVEGGKILNILVHDHIILTEDSYFSFADECLINR